MRVCNTKYIIDKNRPLVQDLYEGRVGKRLSELEPRDVDRGEVMRALCELRLYRLPPYFDVPTKVKGRIQNAGTLLYDAESPIVSARVERELIIESSAIFSGVAPHRTCPRCGHEGKIVAGHDCCSNCLLLDLERETDGKTWEEIQRWPEDRPWLPLAASVESLSRLKAEYKRSMRPELSAPYIPWTSPKKVLLAAEVGCVVCKKHHEPDWLWSDDLSAWGDGTCPDCHSEGIWSNARIHDRGPRWYRRTIGTTSYDHCAICGRASSDYAVWGMCHDCYANWQASYYDRPEQLALNYGALSCLLVWPSNEWVKHLRARLPSSYIRKTTALSGELGEFVPRVRKERHNKAPRTTEEAGIDIDQYLEER